MENIYKIWSQDLINNTTKCIFNEMLESSQAKEIYNKFQYYYSAEKKRLRGKKSILSIGDIGQEIFIYHNLIELLLKIDQESKKIYDEYIIKTIYLFEELFSTPEYILNITQFLDEKDKISMSSVNQFIRKILLNSQHCPVYYKLLESDFIEKLLKSNLAQNNFYKIINKHKNLFKNKFTELKQDVKQHCICRKFLVDNFDKMNCNSCKLLHDLDIEKIIYHNRYYGYGFGFGYGFGLRFLDNYYIYRRYAYGNPTYGSNVWLDDETILELRRKLVNERINKEFNSFYSLLVDTFSVTNSLKKIYNNYGVTNCKIYCDKNLLEQYKTNYVTALSNNIYTGVNTKKDNKLFMNIMETQRNENELKYISQTNKYNFNKKIRNNNNNIFKYQKSNKLIYRRFNK